LCIVYNNDKFWVNSDEHNTGKKDFHISNSDLSKCKTQGYSTRIKLFTNVTAILKS
jgi:tyrosine-protein phosphatase YwqE